MKRKLTKAEYDALTPEMKLLYVIDGDGFKLPLVDDDDPDALRRARDREKEDAKTLRQQVADLTQKLDTMQTDPARKSGDIATLERSWSDKLAAKEKELTDKLTAKTTQLEKVLIAGTANQIAAAITAKPENASLMLPHITPRLEVVYDGEVATVKIKDATGRISALNVEEFQKELTGNPVYASVVVGSKASGAGGSGGSGKSGASGGAGGDKKFAEMTGPERTALYQSNRAEFDRLSAEAKQEAAQAKFAPKTLRFA